LSKHRRSPIEQFGQELNAFCLDSNVSMARIAEVSFRSKTGVYRAWCKTELASWKLIEDVVRAICEICQYPEDKEQETLDYWRRRYRAAEAEVHAAEDHVASRLNDIVERLDQHTYRTDRLEQTLQSLTTELAGLQRSRPSDPEATLYFGHPSGREADQPEWLTEIRRHIVRFEQEAERLRAESQQADLRARELAEHARQVQSRADELHRYLATLFPPPERPSLPGQVLRQE
jgi:Txe/YoeB family toxin of Txe-Axe toxin-antitoxin module